jgi:hypothetical protein
MSQVRSQDKDRRRYLRRSLDIDGVIVLPGERRVMCSVVDVSETGAQIALDTPEELPHRFMLKIERPVPVYRFCQFSWRQGAIVGVWFPHRPVAID